MATNEVSSLGVFLKQLIIILQTAETYQQ